MGRVSFRIAQAADIDTLIEMRVKFALDMRPNDDEKEKEKLYSETKKYVEEKFYRNEYIGILGELDGKTASTAGLLLYELPPLIGKNNRLIGHVLNFYTIPEYRNRGIGKDMMDFVIQTAREKGIKRLFLNATKMGEGLYRKCGFFEAEEKALILDVK